MRLRFFWIRSPLREILIGNSGATVRRSVPMPTAVNRDQPQTAAFKPRPQPRQHFSMLVALTLLLTTLLVLVVNSDREFWLASIQSAWSEIIGPDVPRTTAQNAAPAASPRTHLKPHKQAPAQ